MYCAELIEVDRLGSGARVSANFHIFALTAVGNVLGGQENCPGVKIPGNMSKGGCPTSTSLHTVKTSRSRTDSRGGGRLIDSTVFPIDIAFAHCVVLTLTDAHNRCLPRADDSRRRVCFYRATLCTARSGLCCCTVSVRPSVCLSHASIVSERLHISSHHSIDILLNLYYDGGPAYAALKLAKLRAMA